MTKLKSVPFESFDLNKIKYTEKLVDISYYNLENPNRLEHPEGKDLPHSDLMEALDNFKEIFAKASGHLTGWDFARDVLAKLKDLDNLKLAKDGYDSEVENHKVSGVSFIGDNKKGIQISGSFKTKLGSTGYAAPKVYFESDNIDYGSEAEELAEKLKVEVYAYLFKQKFGVAKPKKGEEKDPNQTSILDEDQNK